MASTAVVSSATNTGTTATATTTTPPLLLLLDGLLSQNVESIKVSLSDIRALLTATKKYADMMTSPVAVEMPLSSPLWSLSPSLLSTPHEQDMAAETDSNSSMVAYEDDNSVLATQLLHSIPLSVSWIRQLLYIFPQWAQTCSARDGSLPLHLAASLGNVDVASVLLHHVCVDCNLLKLFPRKKFNTHFRAAHLLSLFAACLLPFFLLLLYYIIVSTSGIHCQCQGEDSAPLRGS
jgi:hypothetical protein